MKDLIKVAQKLHNLGLTKEASFLRKVANELDDPESYIDKSDLSELSIQDRSPNKRPRTDSIENKVYRNSELIKVLTSLSQKPIEIEESSYTGRVSNSDHALELQTLKDKRLAASKLISYQTNEELQKPLYVEWTITDLGRKLLDFLE